jgi:LmbE family N-acetylglucosaminyl deacetylase
VTDIALSPHFDDAALPVGGILAKSTHAKIVATFFSGKPDIKIKTGWDKISGFSDSGTAVDTRVIENTKALAILGATNVSFGFLDHQYSNGKNNIELQIAIQEKIESVLDTHPENTNIYFPAYFGKGITHPDHLLVHNAALAIIKEKKYPQVHWYMYEDIPYTIFWQHKKSQKFFAFLIKNMPEFTISEKDILLTPTDVDTKMKSIGMYDSQLKAFGYTHITLPRLQKFVENHCDKKACEKIYEVQLK